MGQPIEDRPRERPGVTASPSKRIAVVVIPGVGDDGEGETVQTIARGLSGLHDWAPVGPADEMLVTSSVPKPGRPAKIDALRTWRLRLDPKAGADHTVGVDLYEMRWSDLSRFPPGLLRFLYAVYGLVLQFTTIGLESLSSLWRLADGVSPPTGSRRAKFTRRCLNTFSWLLAVPVLITTGLLLLMTGAAFAAAELAEHQLWLAWTIVAVLGVVGIGVAWWGGKRLSNAGWRYEGSVLAFLMSPLIWAFLILAGGIALEVWRIIQTGFLATGTANALASAVAWGLRPAWIVAAAVGVLCVGALAALRAGKGGEGVGARTSRSRVVITALTSISFASIGLVLANSVLFAAFAPLADRVLGTQTWPPKGEGIRCLADSQSWTLTICPSGDPRTQPAAWGKLLLQEAFAPVPFVLVAAAALLALALIALGPYLGGYPFRRSQAGDRGEAHSLLQGRAYSWGLRTLGGPTGGVVMALAVVGTAAFTLVSWIDFGFSPSLWPALGVETGAALSLGLAVVLALVRVLGANPDPRTWFGNASGNLEKVRVGLDLPYDIATYLRIGHGGDGVTPRERILERYRTLLAHICGGSHDGTAYDGLLFVAHSQGTVLTAATLFGDPARQPPAEPILTAWAADGPSLPAASMTLLTFGSPLRQIYAPRFPGQFDRLLSDGGIDIREAMGAGDQGPEQLHWINVYRAGDFIGRSLWRDATEPVVGDPEKARAVYPERGCEEACIGVGQHTSYWSDPRFLPWVRYAVLVTAGAQPFGDAPPFGDGAVGSSRPWRPTPAT